LALYPFFFVPVGLAVADEMELHALIPNVMMRWCALTAR
jgi:hypothetical protein